MGKTLRFKVDKLIRDGLPEMMRRQGLSVFIRRLDEAEFVQRLKDKLVEEAGEAHSAASRDALVEELADLREVVLALLAATGISEAEVEDVRTRKRAERGGFDYRVHNAAVEGEAGADAVAYYLARPTQYPPETQ